MAPDIGTPRPAWRPLAGPPGDAAPRLFYTAGRTGNPRLRFYVLKIDLDDPALDILVGAGTGAPARYGHVPSVRVSSFVRDRRLLAGINTVPFDPSSAREGEDRRVVGLGIAGGRLIAPPVPRYDALVFYRDGGAAIVNQGEIPLPGAEDGSGGDYTGEILHAAGGFHCILRDGELTERARHRAAGPRYARSAVGLDSGGRTLYLAAIDGGLPGRRGATEAETALILKQIGARDVLNLDGGGSSALALRFPPGAAGGGVRVVNTPSHRGLPGRERAVALCLGIGSRDPALQGRPLPEPPGSPANR
jgi:hypothetical protein